jgi:hypothetical protein
LRQSINTFFILEVYIQRVYFPVEPYLFFSVDLFRVSPVLLRLNDLKRVPMVSRLRYAHLNFVHVYQFFFVGAGSGCVYRSNLPTHQTNLQCHDWFRFRSMTANFAYMLYYNTHRLHLIPLYLPLRVLHIRDSNLKKYLIKTELYVQAWYTFNTGQCRPGNSILHFNGKHILTIYHSDLNISRLLIIRVHLCTMTGQTKASVTRIMSHSLTISAQLQVRWFIIIIN